MDSYNFATWIKDEHESAYLSKLLTQKPAWEADVAFLMKTESFGESDAVWMFVQHCWMSPESLACR